jgi:diguanylate cyclase (GGDEF)-like protein
MLYALLNVEVRTLIAVLFWGNLISVLLILSYKFFSPDLQDRFLFSCYSVAKFLQAMAYFFLFFRGVLPDIVSVNFGNTLLMMGFCLEAMSMLIILQVRERAPYLLLLAILGIALLLFNGIEFFYPVSSIRIVSASFSVFLIMIIPNVKILMTKKNIGMLKRVIGGFYLVFSSLLIPRAVYALFHDISLSTNAFVQSLTFISLVLLMVFGLSAYLLLMKENADKLIYAMANMDYLTQLPNRHKFFESARRLFDQNQRGGTPLCVLFLDIDHFKRINDRYGHPFGDKVLITLADILRKNLRSSDLFCRYGGEEFVLVLHNTNMENTAPVTARIMNEVAKARFPQCQDADFGFTVSIGVYGGFPGQKDVLEDFIEKADKALYNAKHSGRNKAMAYTESGIG